MEIEDIIKWVDDTNEYLANPVETARSYKEGVGYELENDKYKYAITTQLLRMDKDSREFYIKRLLRNIDDFVFILRCNAYSQEKWWEIEIKDKKEDWVWDIADYIWGKDYVLELGEALFIDLLKFYVEIIRLCREGGLDICELVPKIHKDIFVDIEKFVMGDDDIKCENNSLGSFLVKDGEKVLRVIDAEMNAVTKCQGRLVALMICALVKYGYMINIDGKIQRIWQAFNERYPNKVATRQSVNNFISVTMHPGSSLSLYKAFTDEELEQFRNKIIAQ